MIQNLFGDLSLEETQLLVKIAAQATAANTDALASTLNETPNGAKFIQTQPVAADPLRISFTKAIVDNVDPLWGTTIITGSGMTVNQTGGNLVLTSGTTARSETIIRSNTNTYGDFRLRFRDTLSQRIANSDFVVELVDVIGDNLPYTITSATEVVVTFPAGHGFTSANVGQSVSLGAFNGSGTFLGGRYPIASVVGDNVTFTVSAFAAGTGTVSAFGWNFYRLTYTSTVATTVAFDAGRSGWATGNVNLTINTSASPGHMTILSAKDMIATVMDGLVANSGSAQFTYRGNRVENVPTDKTVRLQLRVLNGSTAPATSTTWTVGMVSVYPLLTQDVSLQDIRPMSTSAPIPVEIIRNVAQTVTANQGTWVTPTAYNLNSAATTNLQFIKSTAGTLYNVSASNLSGTQKYVKLYNKASAPTLASDIPIVVIPVPASSAVQYDFGAVGHRFTTGIAHAIVGGITDTDATAVALGDIKLAVSYI